MIENKEKVIKKLRMNDIRTGYLDDDGEFITHSFNDEPAIIYDNGTKIWYKDGLSHRDNNLPAVIRSNGYNSYYKNNKHYWFINNKEYHDKTEIKEKFKNKILKLKNINIKR